MTRQRIRALGAIWLIAFLLWLPLEDTQIWASSTLALGLCVWLAMRNLQVKTWPRGLPLVWRGAIFGAAVPLVTLALMAFKSGLHGHGFADFSMQQLLSVINAIPISTLAGMVLSGLSLLIQRNGTRVN